MYKSNIPIPEVRKSEIVHHGFFDVRIDQLNLPSGVNRDYTVVQIPFHAAAVLAQTKEGKFVICQEYRHPTGKWLMSCPGGRIDTGESPLEAAERELLEETGYGGGEFSLLGSTYPFPAVTNQEIFFIHAKNVHFIQEPALEPFELIHIQLKTPEELWAEIKAGHYPIDGVLCSALTLWQHRRPS